MFLLSSLKYFKSLEAEQCFGGFLPQLSEKVAEICFYILESLKNLVQTRKKSILIELNFVVVGLTL